MNVYTRLKEATEAANRLRPAYTWKTVFTHKEGWVQRVKIGLRTEKDLEYFAKDLATVIVFLDTVLPNFFQELTMLADEVKK